MSCVTIQNIADTECIGASLPKINGNFAALSGAVCQVSESLGGFRNKIINGNFDIWQRGTSFVNAANSFQYTADRWFVHGGIGTATQGSRIALTTTELVNFAQALRVQRVPGNTGVQAVAGGQVFESSLTRQLLGKKINISFYARRGPNFSSSIPNTLVVQIQTGTGTDQSTASMLAQTWSGFSFSLGQNVQLTTTFQKFVLSYTLPTTVNQAAVVFLFNGTGTAGASDYFDIAGVQLEEGPTATPFEYRPIGTELALCQRYYEKSYPIEVAPGAVNNYQGAEYEIQDTYTTNPFSGGALLRPYFKQTKRTSAPTIIVYNPNNGTANQLSIWSSGTTFNRNVAISTPVVNHKGALIWPVAGTTVNSGYLCIGHWTVDAEL